MWVLVLESRFEEAGEMEEDDGLVVPLLLLLLFLCVQLFMQIGDM
jgi:hypothetical protein